MPNGVEKKRQATDNRVRNAPLENIPAIGGSGRIHGDKQQQYF